MYMGRENNIGAHPIVSGIGQREEAEESFTEI